MSDPSPNVSNVAEDSENVGAQAQFIYGGVYNTYFTRPGATAKEKYELGLRYLDGGVPSLALMWIDRAIAEQHDTSEAWFYCLLALLSGRTSRQLSSEDTSRLEKFETNPVVSQSDPWADGIRAVLQLLRSLGRPGTDPTPSIDALERLCPAQKGPIFQHLTVFLMGPKGNQIWRQDIEAAEKNRYAGDRNKHAKYFFYLPPAEVRPRRPIPAMVSTWDYAKAFAVTTIFVLALLGKGAFLVSHGSIAGIVGFIIGCGGMCLAAANWVEFRWQSRQRAKRLRLLCARPAHRGPQK